MNLDIKTNHDYIPEDIPVFIPSDYLSELQSSTYAYPHSNATPQPAKQQHPYYDLWQGHAENSAADPHIDQVMSAVSDSGAQYVTAGTLVSYDDTGIAKHKESPHFLDVVKAKFNGGKNTVEDSPEYWEQGSEKRQKLLLGKFSFLAARKMEAEDRKLYVWVRDNVTSSFKTVEQLNDDGTIEQVEVKSWDPIDQNDKFLKEHRLDVILQTLMAIDPYEPAPSVTEIVTSLTGGKTVPEDVFKKMLKAHYSIAESAKELCPSFKFDTNYIDWMIDGQNSYPLMRQWGCIQPDCLQYAIDRVITSGHAYNIEQSIDAFPDTIMYSEQTLMTMAEFAPSVVVTLLEKGKLPVAESSVRVLKELSNCGYSDSVARHIGEELICMLGTAEVVSMLGGHLPTVLINRLEKLGLLGSEGTIDNLIGCVPYYIIQAKAKMLSRNIQSRIFQKNIALSSETSWIESLSNFTKLKDEDYQYLFFHIELLKAKLDSAALKNLFSGAEGAMLQRYTDELEPWVMEHASNVELKQQKNASRGAQRTVEGEYLLAGNFQLGAYEYGEPITDEQIIEAFETGHCVRVPETLRNMANDRTRSNEVTCLFSKYQDSEGYDNSRRNSNKKTITEQRGLRQLLNYLENESHRKGRSEVYVDTADNLTFIGEKEYAEASRGIALYWKSYLDKNPESQLYVETPVTGSNRRRIKSDVYMLDRILAHFTDEEMKQYKGRLVVSDTSLLQKDSAKLKVVLIDDWTISGTQIRSGYREFAGKNPELAECLEIQLIVASSDRIARGLENLSYTMDNARVGDENVPIVTRAYFVAHRADETYSSANGARISGSHSSVDFGFTNDLSMANMGEKQLPGLVSVCRPYRQEGYSPTNLERLEKMYESENGSHDGNKEKYL